MQKVDVSKHTLVPKHTKVSERERKELFEKYAIELKELPRMLLTDPSIQELDVKVGEIIKIVRRSPTAGTHVFYRRVVSK